MKSSPQKPVVSITLDPSPASGTCRPPHLLVHDKFQLAMWWVYNECMNSVNDIVHRILPHYQPKC